MKKLKLGNVQVQSFVTNLKDAQQRHVRGGATNYGCEKTGEYVCWTKIQWCYVTGNPCTNMLGCTAPR